MSAAESWKSVAHRLAARLKYHDICDNGHADLTVGVSVGCPCCRDREAYAAFVAKVGHDPFAASDFDGPSVNVFDLVAASPTEPPADGARGGR